MQLTRRAYFDLYDQYGGVEFAVELRIRGFDIIATDATADAFNQHPKFSARNNNVARPRMYMKGAVIEGISSNPPFVELVCANLRPNHTNPESTLQDALAEIETERVVLLTRALANFPLLLVVADPCFYPAVLAQLDMPDGPELTFRYTLASFAVRQLRAHFDTVNGRFTDFVVHDNGFVRAAGVV